MAQEICPNCGKEIGESASYCPNCGHALRKEHADEEKSAASAPRPSVFQTWENLPSTQALHKRYKILRLVSLLAILLILICVLCGVILKDHEQNALVLVWLGILAGVVSFFSSLINDLREIRVPILCARWLKAQKTEPIEELRRPLQELRFSQKVAENGADKRSKVAVAYKRSVYYKAVYYGKNPSRKKLEICFACISAFFNLAMNIAFGLVLAWVFSTIRGWSLFNDVTRPLCYVLLGFVAVGGVVSLIKLLYIEKLTTKWYQKVAPDILNLMQNK